MLTTPAADYFDDGKRLADAPLRAPEKTVVWLTALASTDRGRADDRPVETPRLWQRREPVAPGAAPPCAAGQPGGQATSTWSVRAAITLAMGRCRTSARTALPAYAWNGVGRRALVISATDLRAHPGPAALEEVMRSPLGTPWRLPAKPCNACRTASGRSQYPRRPGRLCYPPSLAGIQAGAAPRSPNGRQRPPGAGASSCGAPANTGRLP